MKTILLIRHGMTWGNMKKRYIGRTDQPLCPLGEEQVKTLAPSLPHCDAIFSSPLLRCRQTADILFPNRVIHIVPHLRECDFGIFEGKSGTELAHNPAYNKWLDTKCMAPIPSGEDVSAFKTRSAEAFAKEATQLTNNCTAAFVLHGGNIMAILERFTLPKHEFYDFHIGNAQCIVCIWEDNLLTMTGGPLC